MSCPECGSPFPLSHYGDCRIATYRPAPSPSQTSCLHGGTKHCPFFGKGHPCCDCGAIASEGKSESLHDAK